MPSITELVCELGLADQLVGRTGFCIHPKETVRSIPKVGGTKSVKLEKVKALQPTHVIVNVDENRKETADALAQFVPNVIVTHPLAPLDNLALYHISRTLAVFGLDTFPTETAERYPKLTMDEPWINAADLILLSSEPYRFRDFHLKEVQNKTGKSALLIDGEMTSWYGSRAIAGLEYLCEFVPRLPLGPGRAAAPD